MADNSRDRMISEIGASGLASGGSGGADMTILARGCDPVMAARAGTILPPLLGNATIVSCTDDEDFKAKLEARQYDAVFFAPGACRFSAAGQKIPGSGGFSEGWGIEDYRAFVREKQGGEVKIVETTEEKNIVPLLRSALGLE